MMATDKILEYADDLNHEEITSEQFLQILSLASDDELLQGNQAPDPSDYKNLAQVCPAILFDLIIDEEGVMVQNVKIPVTAMSPEVIRVLFEDVIGPYGEESKHEWEKDTDMIVLAWD